jgi:hypothetical protein
MHSPIEHKSGTIADHLVDSSRLLADITASMVYENNHLLKPLVEVALTGNDPYAHRAARVVCLCSQRFPVLLRPYSRQIISRLELIQSFSVIRNLLKIYAEVPVKITGKEKAILINLCFGYLADEKAPVAVKMFSMQILNNMSNEYPEIGRELVQIIGDQYPASKPGFRSRAGKILKKNKLLNRL